MFPSLPSLGGEGGARCPQPWLGGVAREEPQGGQGAARASVPVDCGNWDFSLFMTGDVLFCFLPLKSA